MHHTVSSRKPEDIQSKGGVPCSFKEPTGTNGDDNAEGLYSFGQHMVTEPTVAALLQTTAKDYTTVTTVTTKLAGMLQLRSK